MGYYIDFVFPPNEIPSYDELAGRFIKAGARYVPQSVEDLERIGDRFVELLLFSANPMVVTVLKNPSRVEHGDYLCWASVRVSWSDTPENITNMFGHLLNLAEQVGGRLRDGQTGAYLTKDSLKDILKTHASGAEFATTLLGQCKPRKAQAQQ